MKQEANTKLDGAEIEPPHIAAASVLLFKGDHVLLVKRAQGAMVGTWSAPGGHVDPGESAQAAAARELREETGLIVDVLLPVAAHCVRIGATPNSPERIYDIAVFAGTAAPNAQPRAGDDASDARFISPSELAGLPKTPSLDTLIEKARRLLANAGEP